jgi:hypothetical protein
VSVGRPLSRQCRRRRLTPSPRRLAGWQRTRSARAPMGARPRPRTRIFSPRVGAAGPARPPPQDPLPSDTTPAALPPSPHVVPARCPEPEPTRHERRRPTSSAHEPPPPATPARRVAAARPGRRPSTVRTAAYPARKRVRRRPAGTRNKKRTAEPETTHPRRPRLTSPSHPENSSPNPGVSLARSASARSRPAS